MTLVNVYENAAFAVSAVRTWFGRVNGNPTEKAETDLSDSSHSGRQAATVSES